MGFFLLIIVVCVVVFIVKSANRNTVGYKASHDTHSSQNSSANLQLPSQLDLNAVLMESIALGKKAGPYCKLLEEIVINNLKCLPKSVLEMEFTQSAIQVFVLQYAAIVLRPKFPNPKHIGVICEVVISDLHEKGALFRKKLDPNLDDTDPLLKALPLSIQMTAHFPPENQTMLLVSIEQYMERKLGHKVRYIGQQPSDNPLNSKGE